MANYFVTGGAGFIGSHIVEALCQCNEAVRVLDNFSTGKRSNLEHVSGVEIIEGDVRDAATVERVMSGVDYVIHLAALVSVPQSMNDPASAHAVNVTGTLNVLTAGRTHKIKRLVLASSCAVYGDNDDLPLSETARTEPLSPYAASKLIGEIYCQTYHRAFGVPTVCLRYFNIFGPRQDPSGAYAAAIPKFAECLAHRRPPVIFGDGSQTRDFVHVSDVVRANLLACECESAVGEVVNVASGRQVSLMELVAELNALQGAAFAPEFQPPRQGDIKHSCGDGAKAARLLQFVPATSLREGLASMIH